MRLTNKEIKNVINGVFKALGVFEPSWPTDKPELLIFECEDDGEGCNYQGVITRTPDNTLVVTYNADFSDFGDDNLTIFSLEDFVITMLKGV